MRRVLNVVWKYLEAYGHIRANRRIKYGYY